MSTASRTTSIAATAATVAMVCVGVLTGPAAHATARHHGRTYLPNEGAVSQRAYRPHWFTFSGDCGEWEQQMRWSRWTHRTAVGHGVDANGGQSCEPVAERPVTITLWRPRTYCGHAVFTRARFEFATDPSLNLTQKTVYFTDC